MSAYTHHGDCSTSDPCKRCFQFGQTTEQKRIIKLLKEHPVGIDITDSPMCDGCWDTDYDKHLIALIKGDNQ